MNFAIIEFDELCGLVIPIIASHAQSTDEVHKLSGRHMKLCPQQRLLNFHFYRQRHYTKYDVKFFYYI